MTTISVAAPPPPADVFGQPRGLAVLAGTQFWEAFSLYGLQALLVLYMVDQLLLPGRVEAIIGFAGVRGTIEALTGPLSTQALAVQLFGIFIALLRFTPLVGGWLGDRVLGRRRTVAIGAVLMSAGHLCMAFDATFLFALLLLVLGAGAMNPNLMAQVGSLYGPADRRRDDGFQLYYLALNTGAFVAPLVCGWLNATQGPHIAFGIAGFGMLGGLVAYLAAGHLVPADPPRPAAGVRAPLTADERGAVRLLCALVPVTALFWIAQSQVWNTYNIWVRDHVELSILGWQMPVAWLQALDSLAPALMLPLVIGLWRRQAARGREPEALSKMMLGCLFGALGMAWLAAGSAIFGDARVPLPWVVVFHFLFNAGWLFMVPVALGLYGRAAPKSVTAMMISINTLAVFFGSIISGRIGGFYEVMTPERFWLLHAAICGSGALLFGLFRPSVRRMLAPKP